MITGYCRSPSHHKKRKFFKKKCTFTCVYHLFCVLLQPIMIMSSKMSIFIYKPYKQNLL